MKSGAQYVATSKVDSRRVPLNPGPRPSVKLVERQDPKLVAPESCPHLGRSPGTNDLVLLYNHPFTPGANHGGRRNRSGCDGHPCSQRGRL